MSRAGVSRTTTQEVFDTLYREIVTFELEPGAKMSEAEIARRMDVSRQPVRDAFFRLSRLGFLKVRPQRATLVTRISESDVLQAAFVRQALEIACLKDAIKNASASDFAHLHASLATQKERVEAAELEQFHELDDNFHRTICQISGHPYVWPLIEEKKAHMDRVRFLSLPAGRFVAYEQHIEIVEAMESGDVETSVERLSVHLGRIRDILADVRDAHPQYFDDA